MKSSQLQLSVLALLIGGVAALLWLLDRTPSGAPDLALERTEADEPVATRAASALDDGDVADVSEAHADSASRQEIASTVAASEGEDESSPPGVPLRGRLIDAATKNVLPSFLLRITAESGRHEDVTTGEDGRFLASKMPAGGTLTFVPLDHAARQRFAPPVTLARPDFDIELSVAVESGPSYALVFEPPQDLATTSFDANLRMRKKDRDKGSVASNYEPVRGTDRPWVRFAPIPTDVETDLGLDVRSRDGLWTGNTRATTSSTLGSGVTLVKLDARAVIAGVVSDTAGAAIQGADVFLLLDASSDRERQTQSTRSDGQGAFRFAYQRAASGVLKVRTMRHQSVDLAVVLQSLRTTTQDVVLAELPARGAIGGRIASDSGTYSEAVKLILSRVDADPAQRQPTPLQLDVVWKPDDGKLYASFEFRDLPAASYRLDVRHPDYFDWDPSSYKLTPPKEDVAFTVHDGVASGDIVFRVLDAEDVSTVDDFRASILAVRGGVQSGFHRSGDTLLARYPVGRSLTWRIDKDGYQPALGDELAFFGELGAQGRALRVARVELKKGWGDVFQFINKDSKAPLAGVHLLLDGKDVGTTDKKGVLFARAAAKPKRAEVQLKGWRLAEKVELRNAAAQPYRKYTQVRMVQAKGK